MIEICLWVFIELMVLFLIGNHFIETRCRFEIGDFTLMKKRNYLTTLLVILLFSMSSYAQNFSGLDGSSMKTAKDYNDAEGKVLECSNYLLSTPVDMDKLSRGTIINYVVKWMQGTPKQTFSVDEEVNALTRESNDMFMLYFVAMAKAVLDNPTKDLSEDEIHEIATDHLIDYCLKPENNLPPTKRMLKIDKKRKS